MLHPDRKVDELNITSTIQLIVAEVIGREEISLKINENGIEQMILLRGGLNQLRMNGYLASTCSWVLLESAILREERPKQIHYQNITTKYPPVSRIERPTQEDYKYEAVRITAILQATAIIKGLPLSKALPHAAEKLSARPSSFEEASHSINSPTTPLSPMTTRQDALTEYAASLAFPPPSSYFDGSRTSISSVTTSHPSVSSSISYPSFSSVETLRSSVSSIPESYPSADLSSSNLRLLSTRSTPDTTNPFASWIPSPTPTASTDLLTHLKAVLNASNLSEAWKDMAGVLLWIGLTFGAASHQVGHRALEKWYSALSMRASTLLSFQYPEPVHCTVLKMTRIVGALGEPDEVLLGPAQAPDSRAERKKRRRV
ncbi:hypothetical protein N0V86_004258 [Didymella sp. IMI 355093]|nr:hypothetical protein N0V86_004258 [Didymella sp. IMI 355093]